MRFYISLFSTLLFFVNMEYAVTSTPYSQIRKVHLPSLEPMHYVFAIQDSSHVELLTPPVGNQDTSYSCVGWAMCYANASIVCYEQTQKWRIATRSPLYNFNRVKKLENGQMQSSGADIGLDMYSHGVPAYFQFSETTDIYKMPNQIDSAAAALTKLGYDRLNDLRDIEEYKAILRKGYPI